MASRPIVPRQPREARNRRALGDIGNLITVRGIEGKPNRPITRSFCAQLLANAQAAAAAENKKKQVCVNVDGAPLLLDELPPEKDPGHQSHLRRKLMLSQSPRMIDISPDIEEADAKAKQENPVNKKKDGEGSSRKKAPAFTSVLTARSKAACGLTKKPKEQIVDIDAEDIGNELAAVEYVEDIYKFYKLIEHESRPHDSMESQPKINEGMRAILVDWLVDVHGKFELSLETLYLTINVIDRVLAIKTVPRRELQLVGISAMLMASKYEEIWPPEVNDFVHLSDRAYTHEQILVKEKIILGKLEWTLTVPTPYVFLARFIKAYLFQIKNWKAWSVYAARCTLKKTPAWNETLKLHTGFSEPQLLVSFHSMAAKSKPQSVYRKYSNPVRKAVALFPPAKALLPSVVLKTTV
ncbi:hypothetical protein FH972_018115 [Carpinus fangiana]|uniref:B-like cyclin n=1 Tax=Carpinus fangiana TaxID=176857 RepID=A0A5N6RPX4_9ROSI|nr:hypothetical protein FH972_018115 [Carpinus fangiana]